MGLESNRNQIANTHSHIHCQATQANAKTQSWQRVCLFQRLIKPTENLTYWVKWQRSVFIRNLVLNGQDSASKPLLYMLAKTLTVMLKR